MSPIMSYALYDYFLCIWEDRDAEERDRGQKPHIAVIYRFLPIDYLEFESISNAKKIQKKILGQSCTNSGTAKVWNREYIQRKCSDE